MRFNSDAYDKAFPRTRPKEKIETVVETFRPTQQEEVTDEEVVTESEESDDGNGSDSESDLE